MNKKKLGFIMYIFTEINFILTDYKVIIKLCYYKFVNILEIMHLTQIMHV